jgi:uncharacterized protein (DUF58 family)
MPRNSLLQGLWDRARNLALRRQRKDVPPLTLESRRIYIVPTRAGWSFAALIIIMFAAGMNYGNGLALLLTFWLASFALTAMIQTQRSLSGARLLTITASPTFAGTPLQLDLRMESHRSVADIVARTEDGAACSTFVGDAASVTGADLRFAIPTSQRGIWHLPVLRLESRAPYGLFRTWTWLRADAQTVVYPRPWGASAVPESPGATDGSLQHGSGQDEFAWLRPFREGDSPRQVAWKAYARGAPLLVREYSSNAAAVHEFDFSALHGMDVEARLSQLCRWVVDAAARSEAWTLRLPDSVASSGAGAEHRQRCLAQLALFGGTASQRP